MVSRVSAFIGSVGFLAAATLAQAQSQVESQPTPATPTPTISTQPVDLAPQAPIAPTDAASPSASATAPAAPVEFQPGADPVAQAPAVNTLPSPPASTLPHDLSPWGMFMAADIVVKAVMVGLAFASLVTWTVWLAKSLELAGARMRAQRAVRAIGAAHSLADAARALGQSDSPAALLVRAAQEEVTVSEGAATSGLMERVASRLTRIEAAAGRRMSRGTGVLATIGSTAPFVGLFGTVWGIMNSFIGISESQTTNLAVVAPGIAEALLATAIGLVAAIPAVVIYNVFARSITGYRQILADASAGVERLVSRDLDFRAAAAVRSRQPLAAE